MKVRVIQNLIYRGVKYSAGAIIEVDKEDFTRMQKRGQVEALE